MAGASTSPFLTWGVGAVGARLGMAPSTLRTWERRYGVGPTHRTDGGHRRYTEIDIERVRLMHRLVRRGVSAQEAARAVGGLDEIALASSLAAEEPTGAEDVSGTTPGLEPAALVEAIAAATARVDSEELSRIYGGVLRRGVIEAWTSVLSPALQRIGDAWAAGDIGVEAEHLASERLATELRAVVKNTARWDRTPTVLLASAEDDQHSLPLLAIEAALAESGLSAHALGARVPADALVSMVGRTRPAVVFVWASLQRPDDDPFVEALRLAARSTTVILGGPGWPADVGQHGDGSTVLVRSDLPSTIRAIRALVSSPAPPGAREDS